jgi:hypothetical protein
MMNHHRAGMRIPVELPVHVQWRSHRGSSLKAQGRTENISGNGLFITFPTKVRRNTPITFTVALPAEITQVPLELLCQGRVVRWNRPGELPGIGVIIDDYELRPAQRPV